MNEQTSPQKGSQKKVAPLREVVSLQDDEEAEDE